MITAKAAEKSNISPTPEAEAKLIHLQRELTENLDCVFVYVEQPEVEPTNNRSESNVRREAEIRKGARTNKSSHGAKRRSILVTVLASLRTRIKLTLATLLTEVEQWYTTGISNFEAELHQHRPPIPDPS